MPVEQNLLDAVDAALENVITNNYTTASAANDVFEAYVWSLIIAAARNEGAEVNYETVGGDPAAQLMFRTSPGNIYSIHRQYTHAVLNFCGCPDVAATCPELEAHIGIYVTGKSQVPHECDVAIIDRNEAILCRAQGVHPRNTKLVSAVECKFYTGTLQLGLARGFLGLTEELTKTDRFLITNSTSRSAAKMVSYHKVDWEFALDLRSDYVVNSIQSRFARMFRNYKVKHHRV